MEYSNWLNNKTSKIFSIIVLFILIELISGIQYEKVKFANPIEQNGYEVDWKLTFFKLFPLITFPLVVLNVLGIVLYNNMELKNLEGHQKLPKLTGWILFRVVTRGNYPKLVFDTVTRNLQLCERLNLKKYRIQVVTDKYVSLPEHKNVRQILVPGDYRTKTGALFKARALQYAIEAEVGFINKDHDWIVHLDEETIMTEDSVKGIVKFIRDGKYHIGQGVIAYGKEKVHNWLTTLADSSRCSFDYGSLRFCVKNFHLPLFSFKGSFVVCKASVEHHVSFDNGPKGSLAEDAYFAIKAANQGYTFGWVDGIMLEKSPLTIMDYIRQRRRWFQGIYMTVTDNRLKWNAPKIGMSFSLFIWALLPVLILNGAYFIIYPMCFSYFVQFMCKFNVIVNIIVFLFGTVMSTNFFEESRQNKLFLIVCSLITIPFIYLMESIAIFWGLFTQKNSFYIIKKLSS